MKLTKEQKAEIIDKHLTKFESIETDIHGQLELIALAMLDAIEEVENNYIKGGGQQKWAPASERLPEKGKMVLLWDGSYISNGRLVDDERRKIIEEAYETKFGEQLWDNSDWFSPVEKKFTHWINLPDPPESN